MPAAHCRTWGQRCCEEKPMVIVSTGGRWSCASGVVCPGSLERLLGNFPHRMVGKPFRLPGHSGGYESSLLPSLI